MDDKQFKELTTGIAWIASTLTIIAFCQMVQCGDAHSAEPITGLSCPADTVSFTDDPDLIRKVDAVIAVTDSALSWTDSLSVYVWYVRHRRLVGVTVTSRPDTHWLPCAWSIPECPYCLHVSNRKSIPGTAVVFFDWEVK